MRFSTGKVTGMKHATGLDMQKLAKLKRRSKALKHSTGEQAHLKHATGKEFDYKIELMEFEELLEQEERKVKEELEQIQQQENKGE